MPQYILFNFTFVKIYGGFVIICQKISLKPLIWGIYLKILCSAPKTWGIYGRQAA
jgi:hypothetical protein